MGSDLAVVETRETRLAHPVEFSNEQVRILAETVAKGCDQNELAFFLNVCKLKRLDPFTGQVHCVKRWDSTLGREKMSIQIGIDGLRVIAARTEELAGNDEPVYDAESEQHPNKATVTVYRWSEGKGKGQRIPYSASARWSEYVQTKKDGNPNQIWATKPYIMLGKCAEALALRKAFPDELSGMYSDEEMGQADNETTVIAPPVKPPVQQPTRASEKKAETVNGNGKERICGVIESIKTGQTGTLGIIVDKKSIVVPVKHVTPEMKQGATINVHVQKSANDKFPEGFFYEVTEVLPNPPQAEVRGDAHKVAEAESGPGKDRDAPVEDLKDLFDSGAVKKGSEVKAPSTIGLKGAQKLWALMTQNREKTGLTEAIVREKILAKLPIPLEHLSDLETGMKEQFEKIMTGDVNWKELVE